MRFAIIEDNLNSKLFRDWNPQVKSRKWSVGKCHTGNPRRTTCSRRMPEELIGCATRTRDSTCVAIMEIPAQAPSGFPQLSALA
jgi:hypothetical protein